MNEHKQVGDGHLPVKNKGGRPQGRKDSHKRREWTWKDYVKRGDIEKAYKLLVKQMNEGVQGKEAGVSARYFLDQTFGTAAQKKKIETNQPLVVHIYLPPKDEDK